MASQSFGSRLSWKGCSLINSPAPVLIAWLCLYAVRPLFLGLYHDDWVIYHDSPSLSNTYSTFWLFANRPILGVYHITTSWLAQGSIPLLQVFSGLTALATALTLRKFLVSTVNYAFDQTTYVGCNIATCLWLMMPWTLGSSAWIITSPTLLSVLGFSLAGVTLLNNWKYQTSLVPWLPISLLISALSYEMFIAQAPLLLGLYYLDPGRKARFWPPSLARTLLVIVASFSIAFLTRFSLERIGSLLGAAAPMKSFYPEWLQLFLRSFRPDWMLQAYSGVGQERTIGLSGLLVVVLVALILLRSIIQRDRRLRRILLALLISLIGYSLSCFVPAVAGYALTGIGLNSRVTIGASFWLAFFFAFIFTAAAEKRGWMTYLSRFIAVVLACALSIGMAIQLYSWKVVWDSEVNLLSMIDASAHAKLEKDSLVVLNRPVSKDGVYGFQATWDLAYAIKNLTREQNTATYIVADDYWKVYADKGKVVQRAGTAILAEYTPSAALVLDVQTGKLRPMAPKEVLGGASYP